MAQKINQTVRLGLRSYKAGQEKELAEVLTKDQNDYLTGLNAISGFSSRRSSSSQEDGAEDATVGVKDLPAHLSGIEDVEEIRRLAKGDTRSTAAPHYEARIAELEGQE
jgi:hypothetical protein